MTDAATKLSRIQDAILEDILKMTPEELRQSFIDDGEYPDQIVAEQRAMIEMLIQVKRRYGTHAIENLEIKRDGVTFTEVVVSGDRATVISPAATSEQAKPEEADGYDGPKRDPKRR